MNISIIYHGVPGEGQEFYSTERLRCEDYLATFYSPALQTRRSLVAEVKPCEGRRTAFFSYIRKDITGRSGQASRSAYFGITLALDVWYADLFNLYALLDASFNKYLLPALFEAVKGGYRYRLSRFDDAADLFNRLSAAIRDYLAKFSDGSDLFPLGTAPDHTSGLLPICLIDFSPRSGLELLRSGSGLLLSPEFETARMERKSAETRAAIERIRKQMEARTSEIETLKKLNRQLTSDLDEEKMRNRRFDGSAKQGAAKIPAKSDPEAQEVPAGAFSREKVSAMRKTYVAVEAVLVVALAAALIMIFRYSSELGSTRDRLALADKEIQTLAQRPLPAPADTVVASDTLDFSRSRLLIYGAKDGNRFPLRGSYEVVIGNPPERLDSTKVSFTATSGRVENFRFIPSQPGKVRITLIYDGREITDCSNDVEVIK